VCRQSLLDTGTVIWYYLPVKRKHRKTLELIFAHPVNANIKWQDIEALFNALGAELIEREGSRIEVFLFGEVRVYHPPTLALILTRVL